jgi:hypothetical protein
MVLLSLYLALCARKSVLVLKDNSKMPDCAFWCICHGIAMYVCLRRNISNYTKESAHWRTATDSIFGCVLLLRAFAKLRTAAVSFVMSVRLFICPHGTTRLTLEGFSWNLIFEDFSKLEKIRVWLTCDTNNGYFTWRSLHIYDNISLSSS